MKIHGRIVPDECPKDCPLTDDMAMHGQNSICGRCPVLVCDTKNGGPLVPAEGYREDWAKIWSEWFKNGMHGEPILRY